MKYKSIDSLDVVIVLVVFGPNPPLVSPATCTTYSAQGLRLDNVYWESCVVSVKRIFLPVPLFDRPTWFNVHVIL